MLGKNFLRKIKKAMLDEKSELVDMMLKSDKGEVIDSDGDETDEIQAKILIQIQNQINLRNINRLKQIEAALKRLDDSKYGLCVDCDDVIAEKRLSFSPCVETCISCAEEREIELSQRKR